MPIGEVIALLCKVASKFDFEDDGDGDHLLMVKSIYQINVEEDHIEVYFCDGNTADIKIDKEGHRTYLGDE